MFAVQPMGSQNLDNVEGRGTQHCVEITKTARVGQVPLLLPLPSALLIGIANRDDLGMRVVEVSEDVLMANETQPDDADFEHEKRMPVEYVRLLR